MRTLNPNVSVDCVVFGFENDALKVLVIQRDASAENDGSVLSWSLPGDLIQDNEGLDQAANRILKELTTLDNVYLRQFGAFGDPNRIKNPIDKIWLKKMRAYPEARVITVAYLSLVDIKKFNPRPSNFALDAEWKSIKSLPILAFDHGLIIEKGLNSLQEQVESSDIVYKLLPKKFTLSQLQKLHELINDQKIDKRNFRKKIMAKDVLKALDEKQKGVSHKPAQLFSLK